MKRKRKAAQKDFVLGDLPATRPAQYFDIFRERFSTIAWISFLTGLFFLPFLLVLFFKDFHLLSVVASLENPDEETVQQARLFANLIYGGGEVIAIALFAFLFSGVVQIFKEMLWNEPIFLKEDFKEGLKSQGLRFVIAFAFVALAKFLINLSFSTIIQMVLSALLVAFFIPIALWFSLQSVYYRLSFFDTLKNALKLSIRTYPVTLLAMGLMMAPFWAFETYLTKVSFLGAFGGMLLMSFLWISPLSFAFLSFSCAVFDRYINEDFYPSFYRKGLRENP